MRNLEIKVKVENLDDLKNHLDFAAHTSKLEQTDTYFLLGEKRLKIREEKTRNEIIYYVRKIKRGTRESLYHRVSIPQNSVKFSKIIFGYIFGTKVSVVKKRDLYLYKNTRIHLDTVDDLGEFIELETVVLGDTKESYEKEHEEVKNRLLLKNYPAIAGSYSDLLNK
ncbi:MAG: class IV adenylate cyclase [Candidatus Paceibacterota bacterium]|jgi:predicted adenylyl cyclase CyaB|nr:class IV adenylate cyclase [Candidatus Paceibacterota bacterium]